jgi:hypothetical protein
VDVTSTAFRLAVDVTLTPFVGRGPPAPLPFMALDVTLTPFPFALDVTSTPF